MPRRNSITMNSSPSSVRPKSSTLTELGWLSREQARASA
jgi:hypothetical protein